MWSAASRVRFHVNAGARVVVVVSTPQHRGNHVLYWQQRLAADPSVTVARELDRAAASDENLAASILAAAIAALGLPVMSLRAKEARLEGQREFGVGTLNGRDVRCIEEQLTTGSVVVLAGGHVYRPDGKTLMLAPRTADVTAVVLATGLGARACHFIIDRDSFDPERSTIHPEALRPARDRGIRLETYSFRSLHRS